MTSYKGGPVFPVCLKILLLLTLLPFVACGGGSSSSTGGGGGGGGGNGGGSGGTGGGNASGPFTAGRTKYVRTDATTEYFQLVNDHWIIYNPVTDNFYVADPLSNHVMVLSAASETEVGEISVPGAYTLDDTADHKTLYIATILGDVYTVDPVGMAVTHRYVGSQIGPSGFPSETALVMADGRVALLGGSGGVSVDGAGPLAFWNPADNSLSGPNCTTSSSHVGGISRTPDRTKIIVSNVDSGPFCILDESTGQSNTFGPGGFPSVNFRISPDGNYLAVPFNTNSGTTNSYAYVYDLSTLSLVSQIAVSGDTSTGSGFAFSADSKTLFTPNGTIIYAYDVSSGMQTGWIPNIDVAITSSGGTWGPAANPNLQAVDGTGLLVGPMEEGVGFIDTSTLRMGAVGTQFTNGYLVPATGPVGGGTPVTIADPNPFGTLSGVYFGMHGSNNISGASGSISATTPAGVAGPADVYVSTSDGGLQLLPDGFSYGPTILEVTPNISSGEGGGTGIVYGYGFGPVNSSGGIPSSLQVSVGGNPVQVTGFLPNAYPASAPPFPLQAFAYTIPPGTASADVTVTSSSSTATAHAALTYLPPIQSFPLPGSALAQGTYDPYTDLYYFTDANKVQVFSRTLGTWLSPISIPAPQGATQRLWGISLSPDGSKLAVADASAAVIYLLNPANPATVQTFSTAGEPYGETLPCGVAVSDSGAVYYTTVGQGIGGADEFFKLDTSTGQITDYGIQGPDYNGNADLRTVISSDNSRVFFNDQGYVFYVDTATDKWTSASFDQGCCYGDYDLALSSDQTQFEASGFLYDYNLNAESLYALNDREILNIQYVYGTKLSPDGTLLFQPSTNGIDVLDARLGNLLSRVSLSVSLSQNFDALVSDGRDNVLVAIAGASSDAITTVDLSSIPEPGPLPYAAKQLSGFNWTSHTSSDLRPRQGLRGAMFHSPVQRYIPHVTKSPGRLRMRLQRL